MTRSLDLTTIRTVLATAEELGATVPEALTDSHASLLELIARADTLKAELSDDIGAKVVAALDAGTDPLEDPAVQQAAIRTVLADRCHAVDRAIDDRTTRYLTDHGLDLLACFAGPFADAAATIDGALDRLGDVDLADTKTVARRGPDAAAAWAEVQKAEETIAAVLQAWKILSTRESGVPRIDKRYRALQIADVPASDFVAQTDSTAELTPWELARKGWPLSLAMPDTYAERVAAVHVEQARGAAAREQAFTDGYRTMHGSGTRTVA
jgi:hypothetical protein